MDSGRMPACVVVPFEGDYNTSAPIDVPLSRDNIQICPDAQLLTQGNRCGHDKNFIKKPTFYGSSGYKGRRSFAIKSACDLIDAIIGFRVGAKQFRKLLRMGDKTALSIISLFEDKELSKLFYHYDENEKIIRGIRSERVESTYALVARTLLNGVDMRTMAFGFWDKKTNRQVYFDYDHIIRKTGLSKSRVLRAIALLKKTGIITVERLVQIFPNGKYAHKETRIFLDDKIFKILGLEKEMLEDRKYANIEFYKTQKNIDARQKYLESYRKPTKPSFKHPISNKQNGSLPSQLRNAVKRVPLIAPKGNGEEIRNLYGSLIAKGINPTEAIKIVRNKYPPPH